MRFTFSSFKTLKSKPDNDIKPGRKFSTKIAISQNICKFWDPDAIEELSRHFRLFSHAAAHDELGKTAAQQVSMTQ